MTSLLMLVSIVTAPADLHPAFVKTQAVLESAWQRGEKDALTKRTPLDVVNRFRRGIGKIRTEPLVEETVSWLWYFPPEVIAYYHGFNSVRKYWTQEEKGKMKKILVPSSGIQLEYLLFYGVLSILPSFGGAYGTIDRFADPNDLKDVRVVLKVGNRIIQPLEQPGDLIYVEGKSINSVGIPSFDYITGNFDSNTVSITRYYTRIREENYNWYLGEFSVVFPLFDKERNPLITAKDTEMEVIVVYGPNERKAKFVLKDLVKVF